MREHLHSRPALERQKNVAKQPKEEVASARTPMTWKERIAEMGYTSFNHESQDAAAQLKAEEEKAAQMKEEEKAAQMKEEEPAQMKEEEEAVQAKEEEEPAQMMEEEEAVQAKEEEEPAQMMEEEEAVQAKEEEEAVQAKEEEEAVQAKEEEEPAQMMEEEEAVQAKEEEEAVQAKEEEEAVQAKEEEEAVQAKEEEEPAQMKVGKAATGGNKGRQTGMPHHVQAKMEDGLGADFGSVRIHQDSEKASKLGALAYTQGEDVYFAPGQFKPESQKGQELIGHELQHVVQQREGRVQANTQRKGVGVNNDQGLEREADEKGKAAAQGKVLGGEKNSKVAAAQGLQKQNAPVRFTGVAATVSWISPSSPAGKHVPDPQPPSKISKEYLSAANGFRFSNHLALTITSQDRKKINSYSQDSLEISRGPSMFGLDSQVYPVKKTPQKGSKGGVEYVEMQQIVGARTVSHEVAGERVGNAAGVLGGAYLGAKIGAFGGPWGSLAGGIVGGVVGYFAGGYAGEKAGATAMNFPPIWSDISLRIYADGTVVRNLNRHSLFPCVNFYGLANYEGGLNYYALAKAQTAWENGGWGAGNPWGVNRYEGR